jgi:hypothetical protein
MNNIQELIERLDAIKALVPEIGMANCEAPIDDAITALESMQAPLPEEVEKVCKDLRMEWDSQSMSGVYADNLAADMLEKLWRENEEYARRDIMLSDDNTELQQRIEELEGDLMTCKQTRGAAISREKEAAQNMSAIAKENKRLDAALNEIEAKTHSGKWKEIIRKARAGE